MSDIPNPLAAFDLFDSRFEIKPKKVKKSKTEAIKKLFSKKNSEEVIWQKICD